MRKWYCIAEVTKNKITLFDIELEAWTESQAIERAMKHFEKKIPFIELEWTVEAICID